MNATSSRTMRLVVNGKAAGDPLLRPAISQIREQGHRVEVRVTWEAGDAARYAAEATSEGVEVVVAAGGDGTINEVAGGVLSADATPKTAVAVIPYGTANDFATGMGVLKGDPLKALQLAAEGAAIPIDIGKINDRIFVNVTSGGFGAEVTASTPPQLKKALGGAAYSLMGIVTAAKFRVSDSTQSAALHFRTQCTLKIWRRGMTNSMVTRDGRSTRCVAMLDGTAIFGGRCVMASATERGVCDHHQLHCGVNTHR